MDVAKISTNASLKDLAYAEGASWHPELSCLQGTRAGMLQNLRSWVLDDTEDSPKCVVLSDCAGSGKSALSHTFAMICHRVGMLGSSFFFSRDTAGRNNPDRVIGTIVRDLASTDHQHAKLVAQRLEAERSLASTTSAHRLLEELVVKFFASRCPGRPCHCN